MPIPLEIREKLTCLSDEQKEAVKTAKLMLKAASKAKEKKQSYSRTLSLRFQARQLAKKETKE